MEELLQNSQISYIVIFSAFCAILFAIEKLIKTCSYLKNKFRIKVGMETDKETIENRITTLEKHDKWQYEEITKILNGIEDIKTSQLEHEISSMRWEILDFASSLAAGRKFSKEQFDHVISTYTQYERIITENGKRNGLVNSSMEVIEERYKECLKSGFN